MFLLLLLRLSFVLTVNGNKTITASLRYKRNKDPLTERLQTENVPREKTFGINNSWNSGRVGEKKVICCILVLQTVCFKQRLF